MSFSTPQLALSQAEAIYNEIASGYGNYYHMIGSTDTSAVTNNYPMAPDINDVTNRKIRRNIFAGKRISSADVSLAIPAIATLQGSSTNINEYDDAITSGVIGVNVSAGGSDYVGDVTITIAEPFTATAWGVSSITIGTYYKYTDSNTGLTNYYLCINAGAINSSEQTTRQPRATRGTITYTSGAKLTYVGTRALAEVANTTNGCISGGKLVKVIMKEFGKGYTNSVSSTVTITPSSTGSGATAYTVLNNVSVITADGSVQTQTELSKTRFYTYVYNNSTNDWDVFVCLHRNGNTSVVPPTITAANRSRKPFKLTSNNTIWQYVYTLTADQRKRFSTEDLYHHVPKEQDPGVNPFIPGIVCSIKVVSGGYGYTSAPSVQINGNGSGAQAVATISGGRVSRVDIYYDTNNVGYHGSGYTYADISFSGGGGSGASARAVLGPAEGWGARPAAQLAASAVIMQSKISQSDVFYDFQYSLNAQGIRDVTVIKNLRDYQATTLFSGEIAVPCHMITSTTNLVTTDIYTGSISTDYGTGFTVVQGSDLTKQFKIMAGADKNVISDNAILVQSQNDYDPSKNVLFTRLTNGAIDNSKTFTSQDVIPPNVDRFSGDIVYHTKYYQPAQSANSVAVIRTVLVF